MTTQQVTRIENPFSSTQNAVAANRSNSALIDTESQRAIAEVQAALAIAKRFPRDKIAAMDRILNDCQRSGLAQVAVYQYARGGTSINGPTIRLAESLAQNWGNIQYGVRELSQANGESTVEAFAWDMETNTRQTKIFQVPHRRDNGTILKSPRDIYEHVANSGARRVRACILGLIPGDVVEVALNQCEETLKAHADTSPAGIQKLIRAFEAYGITKEMIEKRIQCRIEAIKPAQVVHLTKIGTSLREGMSNPEDWFDMTLSTESTKKQGSAIDQLNGKIKSTNQEKETKPRTQKKPVESESPVSNEQLHSDEVVHAEDNNQHPLYTAIDNAQSVDEIKTISKQVMAAERSGEINSDQALHIKNYYAQRKAALEAMPQPFLDESITAIVTELDNADSMDQLNTILESRFEPYTAQMTQDQIDTINTVYERREAELTA